MLANGSEEALSPSTLVVLAPSGVPVETVQLPEGGQAPGWHAGIVVARRQPLVSYPAGTAL